MPPFPAFTDLESLQRTDEGRAQDRLNADIILPGDVPSILPIGLEITQPLLHAASFQSASCDIGRSTESMMLSGVDVPAVMPAMLTPWNHSRRRSEAVCT